MRPQLHCFIFNVVYSFTGRQCSNLLKDNIWARLWERDAALFVCCSAPTIRAVICQAQLATICTDGRRINCPSFILMSDVGVILIYCINIPSCCSQYSCFLNIYRYTCVYVCSKSSDALVSYWKTTCGWNKRRLREFACMRWILCWLENAARFLIIIKFGTWPVITLIPRIHPLLILHKINDNKTLFSVKSDCFMEQLVTHEFSSLYEPSHLVHQYESQVQCQYFVSIITSRYSRSPINDSAAIFSFDLYKIYGLP